MSLINREDLIAEYDRVHVGAPGGARKLMVDAPEVKPEQQWIPCSERLPEKKQEVIVTVTRKNGSIFTERDGWTGTGFWGYGHRVIAWMPLPTPYKEEQDEQIC